MIQPLITTLLLTASAAQASNFFPITAGNRWTYRAASGETLEIIVSAAPIMTGGRVYHKISGYATQPLFVRAEGDRLYWLNEEQGREEILTDFAPSSGAYYPTPISAPCAQDAQAQEKPVDYQGAGGVFPGAREIRYRIFNCADTGIASELYVENLGLVRRVVHTIAGPREFNLASAKVGPLTQSEKPGVEFRISLPSSALVREQPGEAVSTEVTLQLWVDRLEPLRLRYTTSQRYDIAVIDERGEVVYLWSSTALFAPVISEELAVAKQYVVPISLALPDGRYQVEAWLTTDSPRRQFASTAPLMISTEGAAVARARSFRARMATAVRE